MKIVGCDLHARQQTIAMVDTETALVADVGSELQRVFTRDAVSCRGSFAMLGGGQ